MSLLDDLLNTLDNKNDNEAIAAASAMEHQEEQAAQLSEKQKTALKSQLWTEENAPLISSAIQDFQPRDKTGIINCFNDLLQQMICWHAEQHEGRILLSHIQRFFSGTYLIPDIIDEFGVRKLISTGWHYFQHGKEANFRFEGKLGNAVDCIKFNNPRSQARESFPIATTADLDVVLLAIELIKQTYLNKSFVKNLSMLSLDYIVLASNKGIEKFKQKIEAFRNQARHFIFNTLELSNKECEAAKFLAPHFNKLISYTNNNNEQPATASDEQTQAPLKNIVPIADLVTSIRTLHQQNLQVNIQQIINRMIDNHFFRDNNPIDQQMRKTTKSHFHEAYRKIFVAQKAGSWQPVDSDNGPKNNLPHQKFVSKL